MGVESSRVWWMKERLQLCRPVTLYVCNLPLPYVTGQNVHLVIWRWCFRIEIAYGIVVIIKDSKLWRCRLDRISRGCIPLVGFVYKAVKEYSMFGCVISGFSLDVGEICALLPYYAAFSGDSLPTFRDNLSVPSSRVKMGQTGCAELSVRNLL